MSEPITDQELNDIKTRANAAADNQHDRCCVPHADTAVFVPLLVAEIRRLRHALASAPQPTPGATEQEGD